MGKEIQFFGKCDRNSLGEVKSEFPFWMMPQHIDELKYSIENDERALSAGYTQPENRPSIEQRLRENKSKLKILEADMPVPDAGQIDLISRVIKIFEKDLRAAFHKEDDMKSGKADAHEEARRMSEFIIDLRNDTMLTKLAQEANVRIENGKLTRDGAVKVWKISKAFIGEPCRADVLYR
jgi:hypothetical protein